MKWITPFVVLLLGVAVILIPPPDRPEPGIVPGSVEPPVAICPTIQDASRSTNVPIVSNIAGMGQLTAFGGGESVASGPYETGSSGSTTLAISDFAAVGRIAALLEFPGPDSSAASITTGASSLSAEVCSRIPDRQVVLGAGSTIGGARFEVQLMNPYASEAVTEIIAFSESGREAADAFSSIIVPPRSSVIVDVANVLPGREFLTVVVETERGNVVASAHATVGTDEAVWRAVSPEPSWYLPLPVFTGARELVIATTSGADVAYQVDVYGPEGLEEAAIEGSVGNGSEVVDLTGLTAGALGVRVVAEAPVAVFARYSSEGGLGIGAASATAAPRWLLPGAGGITGRLAVMNVGLEAAEMTVIELRETSRSRVFTIQPNQVVEVEFDDVASDGVSIISDGELVPFWMGQQAAAVAVSGGLPIADE